MLIATVKIDGMACTMCEAHIQQTIRNTFPEVRGVKANHAKGEAVFKCEHKLDEDTLRKAIDETGYEYQSVSYAVDEKKGLFSFLGK